MFAEKGGKNRPSGTVIADNRGRIVWYHEVPAGLEATDFRAQTYRGKPVLTWWQGIDLEGRHRAQARTSIYDASYQPIATVKAAHGLDGDLHEFQLTPRGTAYITIYHEVPVDLRVGRRAEERLRRGQRRPGDRHQDRQGRLRVAQPRPRAADRVDPGAPRAGAPRDEEAAARLLPRQLDRRRPRRDDPHLGPQHERALPDPPRRLDRLAARREAQRLRPGRRGEVPLSSTTRASTARRRSRSSTTARSRRRSRTRARSS